MNPLSHRKHRKTGKTDKTVRFTGMMNTGWEVANMMLNHQGAARIFGQKPGRSSRDFFEILEALDESGTILKRLDKKAIRSLKPDLVNSFIDYYTSACVTGMAKKANALKIIREINLAAFQDRINMALPPAAEDHPELIPVLTPIRAEYPYSSNFFLGAFQSRLEDILAKGSVLPPSKIEGIKGDIHGHYGDVEQIIDLNRRTDKVMKLISPKRMMDETRRAIIDYLNLSSKPANQALFEDIADLITTFVFIWLIATGIVDELMDGLLTGRPLLREVSKDGMSGYVASEYGRDIPASLLAEEEE